MEEVDEQDIEVLRIGPGIKVMSTLCIGYGEHDDYWACSQHLESHN